MILLSILSILAGIASLVCLVFVIVRMFQSGNTGLGILTIVLCFVCGIGGLIAFIWGWMHSREGLQKIMLIWTAAIVVGLLVNGIMAAMGEPLWTRDVIAR